MDNKEFLNIIEHSIDYVFKDHHKFYLNMYAYLKSEKMTRRDVQEFLESSTAQNITLTIYDLEDYLEGGSDSQHKQLREAYGHLGKPEARKIRNYLNGIVEDAVKYGREKRPGRKRKPSK